MEKKLVKLVGYSSTAKSGIGEYRDNKGRGLTGFYRVEHQEYFVVMELIKGHEVGCYIFPKIEIPFKSRKHNWTNLALSRDWHYTNAKVKIQKIDEAVDHGHKPLRFMTKSIDASVYFDEAALKDIKTHRDKIEGLSVWGYSGTFDQDIDLEALIKSYELLDEAYFEEEKDFVMTRSIRSKIRSLNGQEFTNCLVEYFSSGTTTSDYNLILLGLLFGHPIESTFASLVGSMVYNNKS